MSSLQAALKKEQISCEFVGDSMPYNHGESAVFPVQIAHMLKQQGKVKFNEHKVRNDSGLMALMSGQNQGAVKEADVARIIDEKINALADSMRKVIAEQFEAMASAKEPRSPLKGAISKGS